MNVLKSSLSDWIDYMQTDIFEFLDTDVKKGKAKAVAKVILTSDSIRSKLSKAIENDDRKELISLFKESMRTFGFAGHRIHDSNYSWNGRELKNSKNSESYTITAIELAEVAITFKKDD